MKRKVSSKGDVEGWYSGSRTGNPHQRSSNEKERLLRQKQPKRSQFHPCSGQFFSVGLVRSRVAGRWKVKSVEYWWGEAVDNTPKQIIYFWIFETISISNNLTHRVAFAITFHWSAIISGSQLISLLTRQTPSVCYKSLGKSTLIILVRASYLEGVLLRRNKDGRKWRTTWKANN